MMKKFKLCFLLLLLVLTGLTSCDDSLDFELHNYQSQLVVDGQIENGAYPVVVLTRSASYFSTIDSAFLRNMVISRAKVTVSDGITEEVLTLRKNNNFYPPYIYEGTELKGEAGKTYSLQIEHDNKTYTSITTIPQPVLLDSLWFNLVPGKKSLGQIYGKFTDPEDTEDYYRVFTQRVEQDTKFIPVYLSAIGDRFFNGQTFTFSLLRGSESLSDAKDDVYFKKGDLVRVKISTMDRIHFDFWRTLERELYVTGNPFSSSGNEIKSNITGGALGIWGGYNSSVHEIRAE